MRTIRLEGAWATREVRLDGHVLNPERSQAVHNHSPDGFNWSYGGSGPAQLALAVCLEVYGTDLGPRLYQGFKRAVIGVLPAGDFAVMIGMPTPEEVVSAEPEFRVLPTGAPAPADQPQQPTARRWGVREMRAVAPFLHKGLDLLLQVFDEEAGFGRSWEDDPRVLEARRCIALVETTAPDPDDGFLLRPEGLPKERWERHGDLVIRHVGAHGVELVAECRRLGAVQDAQAISCLPEAYAALVFCIAALEPARVSYLGEPGLAAVRNLVEAAMRAAFGVLERAGVTPEPPPAPQTEEAGHV